MPLEIFEREVLRVLQKWEGKNEEQESRSNQPGIHSRNTGSRELKNSV